MDKYFSGLARRRRVSPQPPPPPPPLGGSSNDLNRSAAKLQKSLACPHELHSSRTIAQCMWYALVQPTHAYRQCE